MNFASLKALIKSGKENDFIKQIKNSFNSDHPFDLTKRDNESGYSLLDWAAYYNTTKILRFLCEKKPELLVPPLNTRSPIHVAARRGHIESLRILLEHSTNLNLLEVRNNQQQTALDLAIQNASKDKAAYKICIRLLINYGAILPSKSNLLTSLSSLLNPLEYVLHSQGNESYQLLTLSEVKTLEAEIAAERELATLSLHRTRNFPQQPSNKLKITSQESPEDFILKLIDKYLYLCNRIFKESREKKHGSKNPQIEKRVRLSQEKRSGLLRIIRLIVLTNNIANIDPDYLIDDENAEEHLKDFILKKQCKQKRYFGDDLSDNSDSEDEEAYLVYKAKRLC